MSTTDQHLPVRLFFQYSVYPKSSVVTTQKPRSECNPDRYLVITSYFTFSNSKSLILRTVRQACILDCSVLTKSPANLLSEIILVDDYSDRGKNTVNTKSE